MKPERARPAILLFLFCAANAVALPEDTVRPYVEYSVSHDSNYFRLPDAATAQTLLGTSELGVTSYRKGIGMDVDWKVRRQLLVLRSNVYRIDYDQSNLQSVTGWSGAATWNWELGNTLNGSAAYHSARDVQNQSDVAVSGVSTQDTTGTSFNASYRVHPSFYLDGGLGHERYTYAPAARSLLNRMEDNYSLGWRLPTRAGNFLGLQWRHITGEYPNQAPDLRDYQQSETSFNGSYAAGGALHVLWNLGYTRRTDGSGGSRAPTGSLNLAWVPSGRSTLNLSLAKSVTASDTVASSSTVSTRSASLNGSWQFSAKTTLNALLKSEALSYSGDTAREDRVRGGTLSVNYSLFRSVTASLSLEGERRDSNIDTADYQTRKWTAAVRAAF